ncbi:MAG: hypothetical protein ABIP75_08465 [Pyrinomonadaceae bacterium]
MTRITELGQGAGNRVGTTALRRKKAGCEASGSVNPETCGGVAATRISRSSVRQSRTALVSGKAEAQPQIFLATVLLSEMDTRYRRWY